MLVLALFAVLLDHTVSVPAGKWLAIDVKVLHPGTTVDCSLEAEPDSARVDALLLTRADALRFHQGRSVKPLTETGFQNSSRIRHAVDRPGDYVLMIDNRLEGRTSTKVAVKIDLWSTNGVAPVTLPARKRYLVIASSVLFFLGVLMYSAKKLIS